MYSSEDVTNASDSQLVTMIARCNELALAETLRRHGGAVFGLARRVLNGTVEAEDVTQEIFLRLWNQPERFDPARGTLRSFLMTQSHCRAVETIRTLQARRRRELSDAQKAQRCAYDSQHEAWDVALAEDVKKALDVLPPEERRAIELAFFAGLTYVNVAEILDEPEGTVKSRIRNGMRRMRETLVESGIQGADR
jgi:RNA polymerase sigma-70 factor, ECF subfamily